MLQKLEKQVTEFVSICQTKVNWSKVKDWKAIHMNKVGVNRFNSMTDSSFGSTKTFFNSCYSMVLCEYLDCLSTSLVVTEKVYLQCGRFCDYIGELFEAICLN